MKSPLAVLLLAAATAGSAALFDTKPPEIKEWPVPWSNSRPRDPYVAPDGRVWFVGQTDDYAAYVVPATGEFKRYELEAGAGPHNLIVDARGMVWYAGNRDAHIGKLDPKDGTIVKFPMPDPAARDPHTLVFDSKGDIWFTVQGGNFIGKLATTTGAVRLVRVPTPGARPYGIEVDSKDRPWIVLFGTNKLATVDPVTFELREIALPRAEARPRRVAVTSDDKVWYGDYERGSLGRYDPATKRFDEWSLPGGADSRPYAMAADDRDRIWVVETGSQPNRFIGFDTRANAFLPAADVPSGGGTVRHMVFDPRERVIWFGTDANTIGRAKLPDAAASAP